MTRSIQRDTRERQEDLEREIAELKKMQEHRELEYKYEQRGSKIDELRLALVHLEGSREAYNNLYKQPGGQMKVKARVKVGAVTMRVEPSRYAPNNMFKLDVKGHTVIHAFLTAPDSEEICAMLEKLAEPEEVPGARKKGASEKGCK